MSKDVKKVVLAYSGGLDTSVILRWLIETYNCEVICFAADLGQGEELSPLDAKAKECGASKIYIDDLREEFVRDFVFPSLQANALYEGIYLLGTSVARPLIAKRQIEILRAEGADAVCHGATGKGNDQVRFELTYYAMEPDVTVIAPWRDWEFKGRSDLINYCNEKKIPITITAEKPYSMDLNLLHCSYEGGILEDPWKEPYEDMFQLTTSPEKAPDKPEYLEIDYEHGNPVAVNGEFMSPAKLLATLNEVAGRHGVGRIDLVENRFVGMKSRGVYETPGGTVLHVAHRGVEQLTMDRETMLLRDGLMPKYAQLIYNGFWYSPEMDSMMALIKETQKNVTGTARVKLYKGSVTLAGRKSPVSLYDQKVTSFEDDEGAYNQKDAEGFIKLQALRLRIRERARRSQQKKG